MEVVEEVEGWPGTDAFTAAQTSVMDMEIDAIASTFDVAMWFQLVMESGKADSISLACIGEVSDTYYDFFNSGLYRVEIGEDLKLGLHIEFENQAYVELFQKYLEKNQFSYPVVRLYEASLFLSMLPLHMDNPQKVFGFLLNGIEILQEVEQCLKG